MFAWQEKPSPVTWPAYGMQSAPVWTATRAGRRRRPRPGARAASSSASSCACSASRTRLAGGEAVERPRAVGRLGDALRGHRADAGAAPGDDGADGEPVRLDRDPEVARHGIACHDGIRPLAHRQRATNTVLARVRAIPEGFVRAYGDITPGRAARRRRRAARRRRAGPAVVARRARGRVAGQGRRASARGSSAEGVPFRGERVDMRIARIP